MPRRNVSSSEDDEVRVQKLISTAFSAAQRTTAAHSRATKLLTSAYSISQGHFYAHFIHALNRILVIFSRDTPVERLIQFVAYVCATQTESLPSLCNGILTYLVTQSKAVTPAVRFRTIQLIASILKYLPPDAEIDGDIFEHAVIERTSDRIPRVRAAAANALCRMQTTGNYEDDECTKLLTQMMSTDSSSSVRKAAISAVAPTESVIPFLFKRLNDVNYEVRKCVYEIFAFKIHPKLLSYDQISFILKNGLKDRNKIVRNTCTNQLLLQGWMKTFCDGNLFEFVNMIGCHNQEAEVLNALKLIFESDEYSSLVDATEIDVNNLKRDSALILRGLSEARRGDGGLDKFIPTLTAYSDVLKYYAVGNFAPKHLLELCKCIDMSDEAGRKILEETIVTSFLANGHDQISEDVIPSAVRALRRTMIDEKSCLRLIIDLIPNHILADSEHDHHENINTEKDDELGQKEDDGKYWQRCRVINICLELLKIAPSNSRSSPTYVLYLNLLEQYVLPALTTVDHDLRQKAIECLGLFCMLDNSGTEARKNMPIFLKACDSDVEPIQELALKIIVDLLIQFNFSNQYEQEQKKEEEGKEKREGEQEEGEEENEKDEEEDEEDDKREREDRQLSISEECLEVLISNLTKNDDETRSLSVTGLSRLLYIQKISPSSKLLSHLLIVFYNPNSEGDSKLRQTLSVFFPAFATKSPTARLCLEDSFEQICRMFFAARIDSPISQIPIVQLCQFIIELTSSSNQSPQQTYQTPVANTNYVGKPEDQIHERLAEFTLHEIIDSGDEGDVERARSYAKILSTFKVILTASNEDCLERLYKFCQLALEDASDKQVVRMLNKFLDHVYEQLQRRVIYEEDTIKEQDQNVENAKQTSTEEQLDNDEEQYSNEEDDESASND